MRSENEIKDSVQKRYGEIALQSSNCCSGCGCSTEVLAHTTEMGYSEQELSAVPADTVMGLGCGNPTALAQLKEGEVVLDLGSGPGLDALLAAQKVGANGRVIGVDMTPEMVARARQTATQGSYSNVEFRVGEIENLPVDDESVDVIISNCVVNLAPDKLKVFQEALRVLKPGGRMLISDLVTEGELPEDVRRSAKAWAECIAGAMDKREYVDTIRRAGFGDVTIVSQNAYGELGMDDGLAGLITSVQVRASK